jgi:hypothetical protein
MKLELARAMLYNADLLLLDEVSTFMHPWYHAIADSRDVADQPCALVFSALWHVLTSLLP